MGGMTASMRGGTRNIARSLALVFALFALILQANAPIQATLMAVGSDLPGDLCSIHSSSQAGGQDQRSPTDRGRSCALCVAAASTAILSDPVRLVALISVAFVKSAPLEIYQARDPPARTANARAPPLNT